MQEVPISNVWFLCFPMDDYDESDPRVTIIKAFCIFFTQAGASLLDSVAFVDSFHGQAIHYQEHSSVLIKFEDLIRLCPVTDLRTALFEHPEDTISCMTAAVMIVTAVNGVVNSPLRVRILDFDPVTPFKDIKANLVGRLVAIQGTIIRVGGIRSMVMKMNFECEVCSAVMQVVWCCGWLLIRPLWMESTKFQRAVETVVAGVVPSVLRDKRQLLRIGKSSSSVLVVDQTQTSRSR